MSNIPKINIHLSIPFPSAESALMVCDVLNVDEEFESVKRKISTVHEKLIIEFQGDDLRKLRVSINTIFNNILLVLKTFELLKVSDSLDILCHAGTYSSADTCEVLVWVLYVSLQ